MTVTKKDLKKAITFPRVGMQMYRRRLSEKKILKIQKKIKGSSNKILVSTVNNNLEKKKKKKTFRRFLDFVLSIGFLIFSI
jgi:hypothetical protein